RWIEKSCLYLTAPNGNPSQVAPQLPPWFAPSAPSRKLTIDGHLDISHEEIITTGTTRICVSTNKVLGLFVTSIRKPCVPGRDRSFGRPGQIEDGIVCQATADASTGPPEV